MPSFTSRLLPAVMTLRGSKRMFSSPQRVRRRIAQLQARPASYEPPRSARAIADIRPVAMDGWIVYEVSPKNGSGPRRALYLHGGCYVFEIASQHWQLIAGLAASTNTTFLVPIYPLAPAATASTIVPRVTELAAGLIAEVGAPNVSVLGDSAGGGMALTVAMQLRDQGIPAPHSTVLISPWLDISGTDPALAAIAPRDPWLAIAGTHAAGEIYRGELAEDDPLVSPINGDLSGLGAITIFSGTRDIVNADARRLMRLAAVAGLVIDYREVPEMLHVFPILPIPEGRAARRVIAAAITGA